MILEPYKKYKITLDRTITDNNDDAPIPPSFWCLWNSYYSEGETEVTFHKEEDAYEAIAWLESFVLNDEMITEIDELEVIVGERTTINSTWIDYGAIKITPVETPPFIMNIYQSNAEKNKVDKTSLLEFQLLLFGTLRERSSIINPTLTIEWVRKTAPSFNYVYIPSFNRWYFVSEIVFLNNNLWSISLSVDVLMSYKSEIKSLNAEIERQENDYHVNLVDDERLSYNGMDYEIIEETTIDGDQLFAGTGLLNVVGVY